MQQGASVGSGPDWLYWRFLLYAAVLAVVNGMILGWMKFGGDHVGQSAALVLLGAAASWFLGWRGTQPLKEAWGLAEGDANVLCALFVLSTAVWLLGAAILPSPYYMRAGVNSASFETWVFWGLAGLWAFAVYGMGRLIRRSADPATRGSMVARGFPRFVAVACACTVLIGAVLAAVVSGPMSIAALAVAGWVLVVMLLGPELLEEIGTSDAEGAATDTLLAVSLLTILCGWLLFLVRLPWPGVLIVAWLSLVLWLGFVFLIARVLRKKLRAIASTGAGSPSVGGVEITRL